ncbi:transglycosylase domain-containing protein [Halobacillus halophilus]|uniref:transglycosylase domain-containing protein n=1 Tax=Halobacillus halophilus TaxID=1570 RepID=UPI001CD77A9E|nr:PBP1A family penicillin-binding protein [Halobacillus halophilus]MCA1009432.1 PBP1A family penicillin-binding protein [Halobacillus halophilus]
MANESQSRTARRNQMKASKKKKGKPLFKKILLTILIVGLVLMISTGGLFAYYISSAPKLDESQLSTPFSSKVYDMNDNLITDLAGAERRTKVTYDDLPPVLKDAVIATEDSRFYDHIGIDFRRIVAAVGANITSGFGAEGASTITQQVVKRSFLTSKKTIERKVQEQYLAIKLDQEYSKEKILEMYMNKIYYGAGAYGVAEAAKTYFGKEDLSELTLPQAALLAGLPQRPSAYNPLENPDLAKDRINTVLNLMVMHGKISEEEAEEARKTNVEDMIDKTETDKKETPYDAFIKKVKKEVEAKMDGADIFKDGLKIYTTLDPKAQESVEELLSSDGPISWPDDELKTGVAVTDTKTGAIRAIGGGRDYQGSNLNYATDISRQAGSTFKPIMAYGPAIQYDKISTYHQIKDEEYEVNGRAVNNFDNRFRGWVSARYALSRSLNVPAIKTLQDVGIDQAVEFASGLEIDIVNPQPAEAIGGGATGVNPLQMAGAYAAFGNEGVYNEPYTVRKIEVPGEDTRDTKPEPKSAMDSYTAYMISDMLQTTMSEGSGQAANVSGLPEAGKTGTTNRGDTAPDSWFNGYTTNYSISIWTGYNDMKGLSQAGKDIPKQIFKPLMTQLSEGKETADFNKPESVVQVEVEEGSRPAKLPSSNTPQSRVVTELFHVDNQPSKVSKTFKQLDPVGSLTGKYNESSNSIDLNWSYGDTEDVSFQVSVSIDGGDYRELTTTKDKSASVSNVEQGATYQFAVKAVSESGEAESSESTGERVQVPGVQGNPLETPEEESPEEEPSTEENPEEQAPEENNEDAPADEEGTPPEENTDEEAPAPEQGNEEDSQNNQEQNSEEESNQETGDQGSENSGNNSNNGNDEGSEDSNNEENPEEPAPEQPNTDEESTDEAA